MAIESFYAVVPAGGAGTRLWPLSRTTCPKFLLDLTGAGRTLLQQTWDRLEPLAGADRIAVVTGSSHATAIAAQLPDLTEANLFVEPTPRDSMAAIGLAAAVLVRRDPEAVIGSFAADHVISAGTGFAESVTQAVATAREGYITMIGIEPTHPSTAFGYIESGDSLAIDQAPDAARVARFVEKPDSRDAEAYLRTGRFRWNAGMFIARADILLSRLAEHHPQLAAGLDEIAASWDTPDRVNALARCWGDLTAIAIDHAVAEPVAADGGMAVIPGDFTWDDIGDYAALAKVLGDDQVLGDPSMVKLIDASGLVSTSGDRTITVLGLDDIVVIDTPDALLVTTATRAQEVKRAVEAWRSARPDMI